MPSHYVTQCWNIVNWTLRSKFQKTLNKIHTFWFTKMYLKMSSGKWQPFCLSLNVLRKYWGWKIMRMLCKRWPSLCYIHLNSLAPGKLEWNFRCNSPSDFSDWRLRHLLWNCPNMNVSWLHWWSVNTGSGNGLVSSGNKPLPEPKLTQISDAIWHP